jgi:hypothetical protein
MTATTSQDTWKPGGRWGVLVPCLREVFRFRKRSDAQACARRWNFGPLPLRARVVRYSRRYARCRLGVDFCQRGMADPGLPALASIPNLATLCGCDRHRGKVQP